MQPKTIEDFKIADMIDSVEIVYNYGNEDGMITTNPSLDKEWTDNKYIREYFTIFSINPDVINVKEYVGIKVVNNILEIYYKQQPNKKIKELLENNSLFYNTDVVKLNSYYVKYTFLLQKKEDIYELNCFKQGKRLNMNTHFLLKMCILWKKYLNDTFFECL